MTRTVLVGRAGSPGVGLGTAVARRARAERARAGRRGRGPRSAAPIRRRSATRLLAALDTAADRPRGAGPTGRAAGGRRGRRDLRGPGPVRSGPRDRRPGAGGDRRRGPAPTWRSSTARMSRPGSSPPSTTSISGRARRMSATSAGAWPTCCAGRGRPTCGTPTAARRSSSPRTSTRRRSRPSARSSWPGSPWVAVRRPAMRRSSPAASGSRSCSALAARRPPHDLGGRTGRWRARAPHRRTRRRRHRVGRPPAGCGDTPCPRPTAGDVRIAVSANVGSVLEATAAARAGAAGIGLVRTELLFLGRATPPSVAEQRATYAASGTPSRISRSSSGRSTSVATSRPRGRRAAPRPTRRSGSAASGSASIDRPCSTTS